MSDQINSETFLRILPRRTSIRSFIKRAFRWIKPVMPSTPETPAAVSR
jgi:hypothetical protein